MNILTISAGEAPRTLHVEIAAANIIAFDVNYDGMDYALVVRDVCYAVPHMMSLDSDLAEAYDNAFRTQPKSVDVRAVRRFLEQYAGRVPDELRADFDV